MRLFVAVEINDAVRQMAGGIAEDLRAAIAPVLEVRWVPMANLHLTVLFIGHVHDERAGSLLGALRPSLDLQPFDVEFGACGVFPPAGPPRVLWIGLTRGLPDLALMHEEFNRRLQPFGFEPESRPFSAHLTLGRIKSAPRGAGRGVSEVLRRVPPRPTTSRVTRATIFRSHLSPTGPRYEPVAFAELKAGS
jgi:2'-5' RNA ligase